MMPAKTQSNEENKRGQNYSVAIANLWGLEFKQFVADGTEPLPERLDISSDVFATQPAMQMVLGKIELQSRHDNTQIYITVTASYSFSVNFPEAPEVAIQTDSFYQELFLTNIWFRFRDLYAVLCSQAFVTVPELQLRPRAHVAHI